MATVDPEADAQGIEAVLGPWVPSARQGQRIDHPMHPDWRTATPFKLMVEEAEIEARIVRDEWRILDELDQLTGAFREARHVRQEGVGEHVHHLRLERHVAL